MGSARVNLVQAVRDDVLIVQRPEATNKILVGLSPRRPLEFGLFSIVVCRPVGLLAGIPAVGTAHGGVQLDVDTCVRGAARVYQGAKCGSCIRTVAGGSNCTCGAAPTMNYMLKSRATVRRWMTSGTASCRRSRGPVANAS